MTWHRVGMGMHHQVSSLTFAVGMHTLAYITTGLFCQFGFDSMSGVVKKLFCYFWERSFQWDKKMIFLVGYFEYTHERFDLYDQKSCLLPLIIGYWAIGIVILSKVIFIQRRLVLSTFNKDLVRNCWYDRLAKHSSWCTWFHFTGLIRVSRIFEETFFDVFEICLRLSWSARLVWLCSVCKELDDWMTNCKYCRLKSMQWCNC
jgi:hypothetical protein